MRYLIFTILLVISFGITSPAIAGFSENDQVAVKDFSELLADQIKSEMLEATKLEDGSYLFSNSLQSVSAHISEQGVAFSSIGDNAGKGGFGLSLREWGRDKQLVSMASSGLSQEGGSVLHHHVSVDGDLSIIEKFTNTGEGIRQDFLIPIKPQGNGSLHIKLCVNGGVINSKEDGISITLASSHILTYDRLHVTDSEGKTISATMIVTNNNIVDIAINDDVAKYPLTVDPTVGDENWRRMSTLVGTDNDVYAIAVYGNNVYVGGSFTLAGAYQSNGIARWNGSYWSSLGASLASGAVIQALAVDSKGTLYAGGVFTMSGITNVHNIARWNGNSWAALDKGFNGAVSALAIDSNDRLYAGGSFTKYWASFGGGASINRIALWDGSAWSSLGSGVNGGVSALAIDSNDNVYAGGAFTSAGGVIANRIARWNGADWFALGDGVNSTVRELVVDAVDRLYVGGNFTTAGAVSANYVASWDGINWQSLGSGVNGAVYSLAVNTNGDLIAGGDFSQAGGVVTGRIASWNGVNWNFVVGLNYRVNALAVEGTGGLYIAISSGSQWQPGKYIMKLEGDELYGLGTGVQGEVKTLLFDNSNNLYIGGDFDYVDGAPLRGVAKWNGSNWESLGEGINGDVYTMAMDRSGNLYVGGSFIEAGGIAVNHIAKWDGVSWSALGDGSSIYVPELVVDSVGTVYAAGMFQSAGLLAKWDGLAWNSLGGGAQNIHAMVIDENDGLYVGGQFNSISGMSISGVAYFDGSNWSQLGVGINNAVFSLALSDDGDLYAGGSIINLAGNPYSIVKWDGSNWSGEATVVGPENFSVDSLIVAPDGNIYAGGRFTFAGGFTFDTGILANGIARWDGVAWNKMGSGVSGGEYTDHFIDVFAFDRNGRLTIGGGFVVAGGKVAANLVSWDIEDVDGDGLVYQQDNCPLVSNVDQLDSDGDGLGNLCDSAPNGIDDDGDGLSNAIDNCPLIINLDQSDIDNDGQGDVCDSTPTGDADEDGIENLIDNCPSIPNIDQLDSDGDGIGNPCDTDSGGQGGVVVQGGKIYANGGSVVVRVMPSNAGYTSELHLSSPGPDRYIALNRDIDTVVNLGSFTAGTELIFSIYVQNTDKTFFTGPANRNPDNYIHAVTETYADKVIVVGFEDLYGGGDQDYNDNMFRFYGVNESEDFDGDGIGDNADIDDDNDGMPDAWEISYGLNPLDASDAGGDLDADGNTNLQEYLNGTNPIRFVANDFDKDIDADVLIHSISTSNWQLFTMNNGVAFSSASYAAYTSGWSMVASEDFDADGDTDVLLRNSSDGSWRMFITEAGAVSSSLAFNAYANTSWELASVADYNGDGTRDILLHSNSGGGWRVFYIANGVVTGNASMALYASGWDLVYDGDIDGDADADVILRRQSDGYWRMFTTVNGVVGSNGPVALYQNQDWQVQFISDLDNDGDDDIVMRNVNSGYNWRAFNATGGIIGANTKFSMYENSGWNFDHLNDVDNDGDEDVVLRSTTGQWRLFLTNDLDVPTNTTIGLYANTDWQTQDILDLDGNGTKDVLMRNTVSGAWRTFLMDAGAVSSNANTGLYTSLDWTVQNQ